MKKIIFALSIFTLILASCSNDDDSNNLNEMPNAVMASFQAEFENAQDVEYTKLGEDYEIDFEIDGVDYEAYYTADGNLEKYKYDILITELPAVIKSTVEKDFENRMIDDTEILVLNGNNYYQVELENTPTDDQFVFNEDGSLNTTIPYWD